MSTPPPSYQESQRYVNPHIRQPQSLFGNDLGLGQPQFAGRYEGQPQFGQPLVMGPNGRPLPPAPPNSHMQYQQAPVGGYEGQPQYGEPLVMGPNGRPLPPAPPPLAPHMAQTQGDCVWC